MNPVIYAIVDPTAADVKDRLMPVSGTDNGDGTCSLDTTGGGGGGGAVTPNLELAASITVANAITATGAVAGVATIQKGVRTWVLRGTTSSGTGTATVLVQGTLDGTDWVTIGTMTLTLGTTATMDSFTDQSSFVQFRANVTALTGTGASVTLKVGV